MFYCVSAQKYGVLPSPVIISHYALPISDFLQVHFQLSFHLKGKICGKLMFLWTKLSWWWEGDLLRRVESETIVFALHRVGANQHVYSYITFLEEYTVDVWQGVRSRNCGGGCQRQLWWICHIFTEVWSFSIAQMFERHRIFAQYGWRKEWWCHCLPHWQAE